MSDDLEQKLHEKVVVSMPKGSLGIALTASRERRWATTDRFVEYHMTEEVLLLSGYGAIAKVWERVLDRTRERIDG